MSQKLQKTLKKCIYKSMKSFKLAYLQCPKIVAGATSFCYCKKEKHKETSYYFIKNP